MTHAEKDIFDWEEKKSRLEELIRKFRTRGRAYDCVVPVVGDAEDFYTLSTVLDMGMSPLIVCVNDYFKNEIGWENLHHLITEFDVDSFVFNPDMVVYKELVKTSLRKYDHILLPFLHLHTAFPIHVALERKIPLVVWGQNQAIEQVGKFSHSDTVQMSRWSRRQHDLFESELEDLIGTGAQVEPRYLNYYRYPSPVKLHRRGVIGIYLSNYLRWDPLAQNSAMKQFGFKPESNVSSFDPFERAGSSVYYKLHDILKFKRVGYRKVTDHLVREIRHGRITRDQAKILETNYTKNPVNVKNFFKWLGSTESGYRWFLTHRLSGVSHLITEDIQQNISPELPQEIYKLVKGSVLAKTSFQVFSKGVEI